MTRKKLQWGMIALAALSVAAMTGAQIPAVSGPRSHAGADSTVYSPTVPPPTPQPTFRGGEATEPQPSPPDVPYFYYYHSRPIRLTPLEDEIVVGLDGDAPRSTQLLTEEMPFLSVSQVDLLSSTGPSDTRLHVMPEAPDLETLMKRLRSCPGVRYVSPMFAGTNETVRFYVQDSITAELREDVSEDLVDEAIASIGLCRERQASWDETTWNFRVCQPNVSTLQAAAKLFETGLVEYAEPNFVFIRRAQRPVRDRDAPTDIDQLEAESVDGYYPGWHLQKIMAQYAWDVVDQHKGAGASATVAILDTGVDRSHPDLVENMHEKGYDAYARMARPEDGPDWGNPDDSCTGNDHGTAVAGVVAARVGNESDPGKAARGVAGNHVRIMPIRVTSVSCQSGQQDRLEPSRVADGIGWAVENGADVISMSLGWWTLQGRLAALEQVPAAIRAAHEQGIVVVAASGNEDSDTIRDPGSYAEVVTVGGSDLDGKRWCGMIKWHWFGSNYGAALDVVAPAWWIHTTTLPSGDRTDFGATSAATPQVAAVAALIKVLRPEMGPSEIQDIIQRTADEDGGYSYNRRTEDGGWNEDTGFGTINAHRAVVAVVNPPRLNLRARLATVESENHGSEVAIAVVGSEPTRAGGSLRLLFDGLITTNSSGEYNGNLALYGVAPGTYTICAKPKHYLGKCLSRELQSGIITTIDFSEGDTYLFRPGDFNIGGEDGVMDDDMDWAPFVAKFKSCIENQNQADCQEIDLNRNGVTNGQDIAIRHNMATIGCKSDGDYPFGLWRPFGSGGTATAQSEPASPTEYAGAWLEPFSGTYDVGESFDVEVWMDLRWLTTGIDGAHVLLHYDPGVLDVIDAYSTMAGTQVAAGTLFDSFSLNSVDETRGEILFGAYVGGEDPAVTAWGTLATVNFQAIASIARTSIYLEIVPDETLDSNAAQRGSYRDVLADGGRLDLRINGSPARVMPTVTDISPSSEYVHLYRVPVSATVHDDYDQVQEVEFKGWYDGDFHYIDTDTDGSDGWGVEWDTTGIADQPVYLWAYAALPGGEGGSNMSDDVVLDRTDPTYTSHAFDPSWGGEVGIVTTDVEVSDNFSGVRGVEMYVNDAADGSADGEWVLVGEAENVASADPFHAQIPWDTVGFGDGAHRVAFAIEDRAGNWNRWSDETLPSIVYCLSSAICPGFALQGRAAPGERKIHPFNAESPQWISARMVTDSSLLAYLELLDSDGNQLTSDGSGTIDFFTYPLADAGIYDIVVFAYAGSTGDYRLLVDSGRSAAAVDINRDCTVDGTDLSILLGCWGVAGQEGCRRADINLDGTVDETDLSILLDESGLACPPYDFGNDCAVDIVDVMTVANRWRCQCGDPCHDSYFDFDDDCDVDIVDIMTMASHWGCECGDACYDGPVSQATGQAVSRPLSGAAVLRVEPPSSLLGSSETFTVAVKIESAVDLGGFQLAMNFEPAVVNVDNVTLSDFLGSTGRNTAPLGPEIDNDAGTITFGAFSFGSQPGASGDGVLVIVSLTAQGTGSSPLALDNVQVADTGGQAQTVTVEGGRVIVGVPRRIYLPLVGGE